MNKYNEGNRFFSENKFEEALDAYVRGLHSIENITADLKLKLNLNISLCALKLRVYDLAIKHCCKALELDPDNIKALMRRATAYEYIGDFVKSLGDLSSVLQVSTTSNVQIIASQAHRRIAGLIEKDDLVKMLEGVPECFIRNGQALRLMFTEAPEYAVYHPPKGQVKVCIGSEFGLWSRSNMRGPIVSQPVFIQCGAIFISDIEENNMWNFKSEPIIVGDDGKV
jgi:tetratricopeptide (TPR) repeat protein